MEKNKFKKNYLIFTIDSSVLTILAYLIMILMYVYLDNSSNLKGNYLMLFLLILVIILFMGMIGAGFVLNIVNIIRLIKVLIKEGKIAETKKVYITLLIINIVSFIGCVMFIPTWNLFLN
jgi:hypothetical protein